jgi:uncharacterized protein
MDSMDSAQRLVIVMWSCGPQRPQLAAAPFVYALAARALEVQVEMHFTADTVRWLLTGVADEAFTDQARSKTVAQFITEAQAAGVTLFACAMALHEHRRSEALLPGVTIAGAATVIGATLEPGTRTLVF